MLNRLEFDNLVSKDEKVELDNLSWDSGFGETKIFAKVNNVFENGAIKPIYRKYICPGYITEVSGKSIVTEAHNFAAKPSLSNQLDIDKIRIEYKDKYYAVGEYAIRQDNNLTLSYKADKYKDRTELIKLFAGLAYLYPNAKEITIDTLIVGLSMESHAQFKTEYEQAYSNLDEFFSVPDQKNRLVRVIIHNVKCRLQGTGAYWNLMFEMTSTGKVILSNRNRKLKNCRFGIIDIGNKTIDAYLAEGYESIEDSEKAFSYGVSKVFETVSRALNGCPAKVIESNYLKYIDEMVPLADKKTSITYKGQIHSMDKVVNLCNQAFEQIGKKIGQILNAHSKWQENLDTLDLIIVCGGGAKAEYLINALKKQFDVPVEISPDPQFANVCGYLISELFVKIYG